MGVRSLHLAGSVLVSDILDALELSEEFDDAVLVRFSASDRLHFDEVEVDSDDAFYGVERAGLIPEPEPELPVGLGDETTVLDLAAAIHRGDRVEAETLLDKLFSGDANLTEWVQRGRYSKKGRAAPEALRKAA